jgi:hypothetical protein
MNKSTDDIYENTLSVREYDYFTNEIPTAIKSDINTVDNKINRVFFLTELLIEAVILNFSNILIKKIDSKIFNLRLSAEKTKLVYDNKKWFKQSIRDKIDGLEYAKRIITETTKQIRSE